MITPNLAFIFVLNKTPMEVFAAGGIIMWPILLVMTIGLTVIVERVLFIIRENGQREPEVVAKMLVYSLSHPESMSNAFFRASGQELARYQQGMATLDTCITAAPLLGLLGTVTGMMRTFSTLGAAGSDIGSASSGIVSGVAEALIATMFGLGIAVTCLFPYNYLNARTEQAKGEIADASHALEILIKKHEVSS